MQAGTVYDHGTRIIFMYSPMAEMLSAMHVISNPAHHLDRMNWLDGFMREGGGQLADRVKKYSALTDSWLVLVTMISNEAYRNSEVPDAVLQLEKTDIRHFNSALKSYGLGYIRNKHKEEIIGILRDFYSDYFCRENTFIQPLAMAVLKREAEKCQSIGVYRYLESLHERLMIADNKIEFHKNKVYAFPKDAFGEIIVTGNTFISPHLLMDFEPNRLYVYKRIIVEQRKNLAPSDTVMIFKALGDDTRIKILKEIGRNAESTQSLAKKLDISEAGVSKHLKLLHSAGLLHKTRNGNFVYYSINSSTIDFIPYRLYEYIY